MFARQVVPRAGVSGLIAQSFLAGLVVFTTVRISTGRIYSFLVSRPVQFMGRISYSFYLINVVFLYLVWGLISAYAVTPEKHYLRWGIISGVVTSVVTIPFATLSERYVERVGARTTAQLIAWIKSFRDLRSRSVQP
jgi:peptidoglycan/LPS O-acetylase OafA/YrhL